MRTQWGPSTAEMGNQKAYIWRCDRKEVTLRNKEVFLWKIFTEVCHHLVHSACAIIYIELTLYSDCSDFSPVLKPEIENGDPTGPKNWKWGPTCININTFLEKFSPLHNAHWNWTGKVIIPDLHWEQCKYQKLPEVGRGPFGVSRNTPLRSRMLDMRAGIAN